MAYQSGPLDAGHFHLGVQLKKNENTAPATPEEAQSGNAASAPRDKYTGLGGSYTLDPATGARTPCAITKARHEAEGTVIDE